MIGNCTKLNILTPASLILVVPHTLAVFWYFRTFITRGVDLSAIYRAPIVFIHFLASKRLSMALQNAIFGIT